MNILFICSGNISRSYMAEMLLKDAARKHNLDNIYVSSAGLHATPGFPPDPEIFKYLFRISVPTGNHLSKSVAEEDLGWADLILVMEKRHLEMINELWPGHEDKIKLLGGYISGNMDPDDVIDPYGKTPYYYRVTQSQITLAISALVKTLISDPS
jgi:protein-tyrosine-phosphatase